jgi:hypothetical protein
MFEQSRCGNYLECGDMSPLLKGADMSAQSKADMKASMRWAIAVIAICSWIAVSNHCVIAAVAMQFDTAQTECPFHSKPAKQKEQSSQVQCCKVLRAVVFAKTKDWARDDAKFCDRDFPVQADAFVLCSSRAVAPLLLDTGPPDAFSFAELILQRSLLAHAPPFVA